MKAEPARGAEATQAQSSEPACVSVLMNCFNSDRYLRVALESVLAQTYPCWELIFWDNQSTDGSAAIAQSYGDPRIRYFRAPEHTDLGQARGLALEKVTGEFVAILDCDDLWYPQKLERQMALVREMPEVGALFSGYDIISSTGVKRAQAKRRARARSGDVFDALLRQDFTPCWPTVVFRTVALQEAGPFAPLRYVEDLEIMLRVAARWPFGYSEEHLAAYRVHDGQLSTDYVAMHHEVLGILDEWEDRWGGRSAMPAARRALLARARARAWSIAGRNAVFVGAPAVGMYGRSLRHALSAEALFGFGVSLFGPRVASALIAGVRSGLGYGNI